MNQCMGAACAGLLAAVLAPAVARAQYVLRGPVDLTALTSGFGTSGRTDVEPVVAPQGADVAVAWLVEHATGDPTTVTRTLACGGTVSDASPTFTGTTAAGDYTALALGTVADAYPWTLDGLAAAGIWRVDARSASAPLMPRAIPSSAPFPTNGLNDLEMPATIQGDATGAVNLWFAVSGTTVTAGTATPFVDLAGVAIDATGNVTPVPNSPLRALGAVRGRVAALPDGTQPAFALLGMDGNVAVFRPPFGAATVVGIGGLGITAGPAIAALGASPLSYLVVTGATHGATATTTGCVVLDATSSHATLIADASCPHPAFAVGDVAAGGPRVTADGWIGAVEYGGSRVFLGAYGSGWSNVVDAGSGLCLHPHVVSSASCAVLVASCGLDGARHTLAWIASPVSGPPDGGVMVDASVPRDATVGSDGALHDDAHAGSDGALPVDATVGNDASPPDDATGVVVGPDGASRGLQFHGGACQCAVGPGAGRGRGWGLAAFGALALGARRRRRRAGYRPV